jgi:hypothetical protein
VSRIWNALKEAEKQRLLATQRNQSESQRQTAERRDGMRVVRKLGLLVYGSGDDNQPFHERSYSLEVSERGGLISVVSAVAPGQRLMVINQSNQEEMECRVVHVAERIHGRMRVGVEFLQNASTFWGPIVADPANESSAAEQ